MPALHIPHAANLVDGSLGTAAFVATTAPLRYRLLTANGSGTAAGTELASGGNYTAGGGGSHTVTFSAASTTTGQAVSSSAVTVTNMPAPAGGSIVGIELWDSAGTPARKWYGALQASKAVNAGDTFSIAAGSLTVTLT